MSARPDPLPLPDPHVVPLKANVFASFQNANTALFMMFPYAHRGAIVPSITVQSGHPSVGSPGYGDGSFFHRNSEEEVILLWGASDPKIRPGNIIVLGKQHGVSLKLADPSDPSEFNLSTITTRQTDVREHQPESIVFRCPNCNTKLLQRDFEGNAENLTDTDSEHAPIPGLYPFAPTVAYGIDAVEEYAATIADRPCPSCAVPVPKFPLEPWEWMVGMRHRRAVVAGYRQYCEALAATGAGEAS